MKKFLTITIISFFSILFSLSQVSAFQIEPDDESYLTDKTITISLLARPEDEDENAVSINLVAEGLTILNYTPPSNPAWIGNTGDCDNNQSYSTERVCTSMAKTSPIKQGESLGTISLKINGATYSKITKTAENAYSNGRSIRSDSGLLAEFNKTFEESSSASQNIDLGFITSSQPAILFIAIAVVVVLLFLTLWPKIKRSFSKKEDTVTSTPF